MKILALVTILGIIALTYSTDTIKCKPNNSVMLRNEIIEEDGGINEDELEIGDSDDYTDDVSSTDEESSSEEEINNESGSSEAEEEQHRAIWGGQRCVKRISKQMQNDDLYNFFTNYGDLESLVFAWCVLQMSD
ncbi:uncharacterized protein [Prorops nasuta]|uniref:uncharacterized protein n=1 Tax=Prorops nasuta TaxID=863751 RepID=UPI0034CF287D